jgi:uncharacterized protein involved in exopolysaccharide biosynthesis
MQKLNRGWLTFRQRKFPAIIAFGIIFGGAALVTFRMQPIYAAKGQILIQLAPTDAIATQPAIAQLA